VNGTDPGHTFAADNPLVRAGEMSLELGRRIDYVLVRSGIHGPSLDVTECRRVFDQPIDGTWASDHYAVLARLSVPDHSPGSWAIEKRKEGQPAGNPELISWRREHLRGVQNPAGSRGV
jgi:hypothetical protein